MSAHSILWLASAGSTNTELSQIIAHNAPPEWTVVAAKSQTSGRGQAGNRWETAPGKNICCSICLYPRHIKPHEQFIISMAAAVGAVRYLRHKDLPAEIKWPNDLYVGDKKIAGILIENQLMGSEICSSIIGIGLNVNQTEFSSGVPNPTSLQLITGREYDPCAELSLLVQYIKDAVMQIYNGHEDHIMQEYHAHLYLRGVQHRFYVGGNAVDGIISHVAKSGGMTLSLLPFGNEKTYYFKEISYQKRT